MENKDNTFFGMYRSLVDAGLFRPRPLPGPLLGPAEDICSLGFEKVLEDVWVSSIDRDFRLWRRPDGMTTIFMADSTQLFHGHVACLKDLVDLLWAIDVPFVRPAGDGETSGPVVP